MNKIKNKATMNIVLLLIVVLLTAMPFFFHPEESQFSGADAQASTLIEQEHPNYVAWFRPIWEPPSSEIESLLFACQAAIGAGVIGYVFGYLRGKKTINQVHNGIMAGEKEETS